MSTDGQTIDPRASLVAASQAVAQGATLEAALDGVLAAALESLHPATGAIFVSDPDRPGLNLVASLGIDGGGIAQLQTDVADPADPFMTAAVSSGATFDRESATADGSTFVGAYLPLIVSSAGVETTLGVLGLGWPAPRALDDAERETLTALASLAAVAVDRTRLASTAAERSEWFERMAHTDPLTGIANERTIGRVLELELARASRQGSELSLALFDVDDFQATNREGGHEAGDDVLRRVAAVLAESVRLVDTVGRVGGDEFVLVAPGTVGTTVAQRILDGIAALPPVAGRSITVSAGLARFPVDGADSAELIAAATAGLLRAKSEGRGTVASRAGSEG